MLLSIAFRLKSLLGNLENRLADRRNLRDELIVLNLHSTPRNRLPDFERMLGWIKTSYTPFHPDQLDDYFGEKASSFNQGPYLLFTFDDGLKNNLASAELLRQHGFCAIYFIVPDFIDAVNPIEHYRTYIRPDIDPEVDTLTEDFTPMSWLELSGLQAMGHHIGSHTKTHRLWHTMSSEESLDEVKLSQKMIAAKTGIHTSYFCSPNNTLLSVDARIQSQIMTHYRYHFTTLPGRNSEWRRADMVLRRNIEVHWPTGAQHFALGNWDLRRWQGKIQQFQTRL